MKSYNVISFKVNMEKRVLYKIPELQKIEELDKQLIILVSTYDEIVGMLSSREEMYQKTDHPRYDQDDIRQLKDTMVCIQKSMKIISEHLESYRLHLSTNRNQIKNINHCIENFISTK